MERRRGRPISGCGVEPPPYRHPLALQSWIGAVQSGVYLVCGVLLIAAAGFTLVGTVTDVIEGADSRAVTDTGVFVLERILLMFIIAELLHTLQLVDFGGQILVEPFLLIGLIAVVRRILVITAEIEGKTSHEELNDLLLQLLALGGLALVLALAFYLLRVSRSRSP
jgi:uncharacterized membrane protein (DUF373 family)